MLIWCLLNLDNIDSAIHRMNCIYCVMKSIALSSDQKSLWKFIRVIRMRNIYIYIILGRPDCDINFDQQT